MQRDIIPRDGNSIITLVGMQIHGAKIVKIYIHNCENENRSAI